MIEPTDDNTTEWFPVSINPVHVGVYQTRASAWGTHDYHYSHWDGEKWGLRAATSDDAEAAKEKSSKDMVTPRLDPHWRGLREQPK